MTLPQIIVDLMKLLFDMAVPAAICTMVLAGIALRQEGGVNFQAGGKISEMGAVVGDSSDAPPVPVLVCRTGHRHACTRRKHQQPVGRQREGKRQRVSLSNIVVARLISHARCFLCAEGSA